MKSIKQRLTSLVVAGMFILLPGMSGKAEIKGTENKTQSVKETTMYTRADYNSYAISNLNINEELFSILETEEFNLINYNNMLGFVNKDSVNGNNVYNSNISYKEISQFGITTDNVNVRSGPGTNYETLGTIKNGELIDIIYESSNGWYLIDYKDHLGFISMQYAKVIDFSKLESEINNLPQVTYKVKATTDVNIRELPSVESQKLGTLKQGKTLNIVGYDGDWIEVTNGQEFGYVKSDYVKVIGLIDADYYKHVYMPKDTKVYSYPYSTTIETLPKYETAFVYGETEDYYFIDSEGTIGYILKNDVKELNGTYVVVDISDQKVRLYKEAIEILSSNVVTGKDETPSHLGYTKVKSKEKNRYLKKFDVTVEYWLGFNDYGEGLHDAKWRHGKFGGEIYHKKGSHGCINTPNDAIREIYDEVEIGDKVLVKR